MANVDPVLSLSVAVWPRADANLSDVFNRLLLCLRTSTRASITGKGQIAAVELLEDAKRAFEAGATDQTIKLLFEASTSAARKARAAGPLLSSLQAHVDWAFSGAAAGNYRARTNPGLVAEVAGLHEVAGRVSKAQELLETAARFDPSDHTVGFSCQKKS